MRSLSLPGVKGRLRFQRNESHDFAGDDDLKARGESAGDEDERTVVDLLTDQVEFADVLVLNKTDLVGKNALGEVERTLKALNPGALLIKADHARVPLKSLLNTGRFDFDKASRSAAWIRELEGVHTPETEEYGISSFVYRARKPFHPERLAALLDDPALQAVIRAKGTFWLATRPAYVGLLSKAGPSYVLDPIGTWWATLPEDRWGVSDEERQAILSDWHPEWGDRAQQLVFIGIGLDEGTIRARLEAALVTDEEAEAGVARWHSFADPLPAWK